MLHYCSVIAFGFGNLAMLGWLAAAAAPLLIHLWSRHRFREAPWAAMQFLLAAMRKNARRLQLQQWLLLAVRTLIIAMVVLAAAEPYGEQLLAGGGAAPTHKVLVLDGSYSMACRDGDATHFARARQLAAALVRDSRPADCFTVILMAAPAKTILSREVIDHRAVASQIEDLTQPHSGADLAGTLTLVQEALTSGRSARRTFERQEVYFFTDLQRSTWGTTGSHAERGNEERFAGLAQHARLAVIDLGQPPASNLAVTDVSIPDSFVTLGRAVAFEVALRQFGRQSRPACVVELLVDDEPVGEQTVDVPADGAAAVRFTYRFQAPGHHTVTVRAAGDRLDIDNSRSLVVPVREEVRVLCVAGRERAAKYVAEALNPNPAGDSPIRPVIVSEADLAEVELPEFDCVFMCNVAQLTASEAARLARYAASGGGIVFFLGDRVVVENYNALASFNPEPTARVGKSTLAVGSRLSDAHREPLLPARLGELVSESQAGLDPLEYRHPIVAPFRGRERAGLLSTPIAKCYRLEVDKNRPAIEVAAAIGGGDPFIVAAPLGRGRTVLVATDGSLASVDPATGEPWTQWPTWPSFLPIVRELLTYATGAQQNQWQQIVGTSIESRREGATSALRIVRPDGRTEPVALHTSSGEAEWSYSRTDVSGIYTLRGSQQGEAMHFAVNVDAAEGDLAKVDLEELPSELEIRDTASESTDTAVSAGINRAAWNQSVLWAVFALLFVELFLAWRFGRGIA